MKPVRQGTRGAAVEDIQRRLLLLGYDLGPTGIDGVFFGRTAEALRAFQDTHSLSELGIVGDETWAALVDATFTFGDRTLYLRLPHFHGRDVGVLQQALNVLGFACGRTDGIFGAYTERAVREFQRNAGLPHDGIVGADTVRTLSNLKHVWEGKEARPHSAARVAPARAAEVLMQVPMVTVGDDESGRRVAVRVANLAVATTSEARLHTLGTDDAPPPGAVIFRICATGCPQPIPGRPHVRVDERGTLSARLMTALATVSGGRREVVLELGQTASGDDVEEQRAAVAVLDAICAAVD
jgi:peptidoglycan hydrolase-like protein with peptidoglycan-binding domain